MKYKYIIVTVDQGGNSDTILCPEINYLKGALTALHIMQAETSSVKVIDLENGEISEGFYAIMEYLEWDGEL